MYRAMQPDKSPDVIKGSWLEAANLFADDGDWMSPGWLRISPAGEIVEVSSQQPPEIGEATIDRLPGFVIPGFANLHSHVHQRALAGRAERLISGQGKDSFWTWRETMYRLLNRLDADAFEAVASLAFMEMVKTGFTTVGEFHYLHHQENGDRYDDPAELAGRLIAAREQAGIGLCLLPVLYRTGGIGRPADDGQRRFVSRSVADWVRLMEVTEKWAESNPLLSIGAAPHSLRAVPAEELREIVMWWRSLAPDALIHIHISEQRREVDELLAAYGQRPVAWLAEQIGIDRNWTLIHATHVDEGELRAISDANATVGLCPSTEANLGDGFFPFPVPDPSHQRMTWGIGSDSNVRVDAIEEVRLLEYGQRLIRQRRSILIDAEGASGGSPGRSIVRAISRIAEQALGHRTGRFKPGYRADLMVLDPSHPALDGHGVDTVLDALVVSGDRSCVSDVMVAGEWIVRARRHCHEEAIVARWRDVRSRLME